MPPVSQSSRWMRPGDFFRDVRRATSAVGCGGNTAGDGFADHEEIGFEAVGVGIATGTRADGVRLVNDEEGAERSREGRRLFPSSRARDGRCRRW